MVPEVKLKRGAGGGVLCDSAQRPGENPASDRQPRERQSDETGTEQCSSDLRLDSLQVWGYLRTEASEACGAGWRGRGDGHAMACRRRGSEGDGLGHPRKEEKITDNERWLMDGAESQRAREGISYG